MNSLLDRVFPWRLNNRRAKRIDSMPEGLRDYARAKLALRLLLTTEGWRKVERDIRKLPDAQTRFKARYELAKRLIVLRSTGRLWKVVLLSIAGFWHLAAAIDRNPVQYAPHPLAHVAFAFIALMMFGMAYREVRRLK